jgi:hypothetical protein
LPLLENFDVFFIDVSKFEMFLMPFFGENLLKFAIFSVAGKGQFDFEGAAAARRGRRRGINLPRILCIAELLSPSLSSASDGSQK